MAVLLSTMHVKRIALVATLLAMPSCSEKAHSLNEVRKTATFCVLEQLMDTLDKETLVIFDLDNTIWRGKTYLDPKIRQERDDFLQSLANAASTPAKKSILEKKFYAQKRELVEPEIVDLIKQMQAKGVKIIALTGGQKRKDPLGIIRDYPRYHIAMLNNLGIDLKGSFPNLEKHEFFTLGKTGEAPLFEDGILFGSRRPKGVVLEAFLSFAGWEPNRIIVFDNDERMVNDFAATTKKLRIPSIIYECTRARSMAPFDIERFKRELQ
jgi:hypothetical protein